MTVSLWIYKRNRLLRIETLIPIPLVINDYIIDIYSDIAKNKYLINYKIPTKIYKF